MKAELKEKLANLYEVKDPNTILSSFAYLSLSLKRSRTRAFFESKKKKK
jgi:hypothetical protein